MRKHLIHQPRMARSAIALFLFFASQVAFGQEKYTISGYIKDAANGETLIGATVYIPAIGGGGVTNVYGFYSITLAPGTYNVQYRFIGYESVTRTVELTEDTRIDLELSDAQQELEAVVVSARSQDANVSEIEMSTAELDIKTIEKIPAFLGEVDVVRSLQLIPGVSTVGEGASGFNVRGGGVGQNLVLLDEAPVYNSSHLLGFFSVFNPDAVKDVKLYKGGIPAQYGGRISSILDIRMKEGNAKKFEVNGCIGSIFSRLAVEGPIVKDKASFIVAGRRSYADILARPFSDIFDDGAALNFYDLTLKTNYNINEKNRVYLSGYLGRDVFRFDERQGFSWGNRTATLRWNHLFSDKLFANFTLFYSDYDYSLAFGENDRDKFEWDSRIRTYNAKTEFTYFANTQNELTFGGEALLYRFRPADAVGVSDGESTDISLDEKKALETALYVGNEQTVNDRLTLQYGLRFSNYTYLGDGTIYTFGDTIPGIRKPLIGTEETDNFEAIETFNNLEPRFSFKYQLSINSSIKGSYNFMSQYIHLISNTTASNPLDVWTSSSNNIDPQTGQQVALGYFRNFKENQWEASVELYYRWTENQIDYIDGADLLINELIEGDLLSGDGRAYGAEFFLKKKTGRWNGWVSYTLGRTELQVEGINRGEWYPNRFDQLHNLKIAGFYDINDRWSLSGNFTYLSGTPTTFPNSRFEVQGYVIPYIANEARNQVRIPDYHRLDFSLTRNGRKVKKNGKERKVEDSFVFTVYNIYARRNPFSIYFRQVDDRIMAGTPVETQARQVSIIGTFFPSITYNFKF
ncbi:MAG: TonB-dependent receptor [Bacteroidota bacterium]